MNDLFQFADDLGPAKVIGIYEPKLNLRAIVVVDNVAAGPALSADAGWRPTSRLANAFGSRAR